MSKECFHLKWEKTLRENQYTSSKNELPQHLLIDVNHAMHCHVCPVQLYSMYPSQELGIWVGHISSKGLLNLGSAAQTACT